jgi:hypothetical protein
MLRLPRRRLLTAGGALLAALPGLDAVRAFAAGV